ncbi:MAG: hypothetical protein LBI79_01700 [Nitrososphaerota archaeon]|jgi:protein-arginine kinase activator protein McsA|nr:hypothetical protein [Nitrososphaerota archaeon]
MAKPICQVCGQTYRGIALNTVKNGKEVEVCPACYKTLDAEYRKNSCMACVFFHIGNCELFGTELDEPYVQNARCEYFTTSNNPDVVADVKAKAEATRKEFKEKPAKLLTIDELVAELGKRGQMLTYFCCHCGTPLKIGIKQEIQKACPNCKYDLSAIDLAKLIRQHL